VALYRAIGFERDQIAGLTSFEDGRVDIGAMGYRIGIMEAFEETRVLKRDAGDQLTREGAAHLHGGRTVGVGEYGVLKAEPVERAKNIRPKLNAGTELLEFRRLFENPNRETLPRQRPGRRQSTDAATRNQDRQVFTVRLNHHRSVEGADQDGLQKRCLAGFPKS
jgi:hypothetical protein